MADFESQRLEIYEDHISKIAEQVDTSHGDFVYPSFTQSVAIDDGYREADLLIEITVANSVDRTLVLMASTIEDDQRTLVEDVEDEEALSRARKYTSEIEDGAYFGLTDGDQVHVSSLDPDIRFEQTCSLTELPQLVDDIIQEERRIKDSREFVEELKEYHEELAPHVQDALRTRIEEDQEFEKKVRTFLAPIGMAYEEDEEIPTTTVEMLAQQSAYLLVDKILFYYLILENEENLRNSLDDEKKYDEVFEGLNQEPPSTSTGIDEEWASEFWADLEKKFELIQKIDYEPIFDPEKSPLNEISLAHDGAACFIIDDLMDYLYRKEELSNLFDGPLLAKIYEGLIPPETRWKWGQIYTPPEVTRLITKWTVRNPDDQILDPACGTGRFLVSAYEELAALKGAKIGEKHQEIVNQIYGIDINQFPAHLATMSLVAMDLSAITEEVNIDVKDFFLFKGGDQSSFAPKESRVSLIGQTEFGDDGELEGQGKLTFDKPIGKVDSILMNPPYTRQQALGSDYKQNVRDISLSGINESNKNVKMSKRAGFYAYFVTHATKFLRDDGRFGMIIQNPWLDTGYGKDLQRFLLDNYKIHAIIGSQRDRLIKTADVNTVIVLLERETDEQKRDDNDIKFVQLKKNVEWFEENYGFDEVLDMIGREGRLITDDFRIVTRNQGEVKNAGMGKTTYTGGKWGRFLRAPDIYFDIVDTHDELRTVSEFSTVSSYLNTGGADDFFFVDLVDEPKELQDSETVTIRNRDEDEEFVVESEFVVEFIESPKQLKYIKTDLNPFDSYLIVIPDDVKLENTKIKEYVDWGEDYGYNEASGRKNKAKWWVLGSRAFNNTELIWPNRQNDRHFIAYNPNRIISHRFYRLDPDQDIDPRLLGALLNFTPTSLFTEVLASAGLGQGVLDVTGPTIRQVPIVDPNELSKSTQDSLIDAFERICDREMKSVFDEIGADEPDEVSLDDIESDRRKLDKILMEDILGLSKKQQLELYRGVIQLVQNRIEKARS